MILTGGLILADEFGEPGVSVVARAVAAQSTDAAYPSSCMASQLQVCGSSGSGSSACRCVAVTMSSTAHASSMPAAGPVMKVPMSSTRIPGRSTKSAIRAEG